MNVFFNLIGAWRSDGACFGQAIVFLNPVGHFHINLYGTCRFSGYHFSA